MTIQNSTYLSLQKAQQQEGSKGTLITKHADEVAGSSASFVIRTGEQSLAIVGFYNRDKNLGDEAFPSLIGMTNTTTKIYSVKS